MESLDIFVVYSLGFVFLGLGVVFVFFSFFVLGFVGIFLGDYFGIFKEVRVIVFFFNILDNFMYWGSIVNYLGWVIMYVSFMGLFLMVLVVFIYIVVFLYEEFFIVEIYW